MTKRLGDMTWPEAEQAAQACGCAILPLGSCEQHGGHLPLDTDIVTAVAMADDLAARTGGVALPVVSYGQVWSAKDFPGTISLAPETLKAIICDVCRSLVRHGFPKIVLLSGHMGNLIYMKEAARQLYDEGIRTPILFFCYPEFKAMAEGIMETPMWKGSVFHAGELETSMMLYLAPEKVDMANAGCEYPEIDETADYRIITWREINKTGVFGDARLSTAEKGQAYYEKMIAYMAEMIAKTDEKG